MDNFRCVWVAGMPRSGSMWTFNVVRELLRESKSVLPEVVPELLEDMEDIARDVISNGPEGVVAVVKVHAKIDMDTPYSIFVSNRRDPRDAMVSYMRFMKVDFKTALRNAQINTEIMDYYHNFPDQLILHVDYSQITQDPLKLVGNISSLLGVASSEEEKKKIVLRFDKSSVASLIKESNEMYKSGKQNDERLRATCVGAGKDRVMNLRTGFQEEHVSNYEDGDWRAILTGDQKEQVKLMLGSWLEHNGYPV